VGTAVGTGSARAASSNAECTAATVQYRALDADGKPTDDWTSAGGFRAWADAPTAVQVRIAPGQQIGADCSYPVSLTSYRTEGPNWPTSGHQTYLDSATVYLTAKDVPSAPDTEKSWQELSLKPLLADCYGQIDLYGNDTIYDGKTAPGHGPLPYQPDNVVTPYNLIAAWNGGSKRCDSTGSPTPSASASTPSAPTPSASSAQPSPSTSTATPSSPAASTPQTPATPSTNPSVPPATATPSAPASSASPTPGSGLAETGAGGSLGLLGAGTAAVLLGGATLILVRRRNSHRHL
jgi:hypothetical protein